MMSFSKLCYALVVAFLLLSETRALDGLGGGGGNGNGNSDDSSSDDSSSWDDSSSDSSSSDTSSSSSKSSSSSSSSRSRRLSRFAYRQRRGLETAEKMLDHNVPLKDCGDTDYDAFLFVDAHIYAVAYPGPDAKAAECPMFVAHAVFEDEHHGGNKELLQWSDIALGEYLFPQDESLSMGTYKLSELFRAYQDADANASGHAVYDIVANNCGAFVVNLAYELDLPIDTRVTSFVVRRLLQNSSEELFERVHQSVSYLAHFGNRGRRRRRRAETIADEELLNFLVNYQAYKTH